MSVFRVLVCEGKDDLAALRAMVRAEAGLDRAPTGTESIRVEHDGVTLQILHSEGKSKLAERVCSLGTSSERPDRVGICFDPDGDGRAREFEFFRRDYETAVGPRGPALQAAGGGRLTTKIAKRDVTLLPAPWRAETAFDHLSKDEHCLERVLIGGIQAATVEGAITAWAENSTTDLLKLVGDHGWKRAFRIWNAALQPKTESSSFVDKLLQDEATKGACLRALLVTSVADVLRDLLDPRSA